MNINAGSDTIASTLRAIFYHLLKNPTTLYKLVDELSTAHSNGNLTLPSPTWHETQSEHTPYLRAVIKEGLRMNPALSLPLERVVPKDGLTITHSNSTLSSFTSSPTETTMTTFIPGNTVIGINPYVVQRDARIFGPNPDTWNPDRWLNHADNDDTLRRMDNHMLAFGAGKRSCMGKNIAMLELSKLVPAVLMRFEIELENLQTEWVVSNGWALNQKGVVVRLAQRKES